jgi:hypothetical protein
MDRNEKIKNLQIRNSRRLLLEKMQRCLSEIVVSDFISLEDSRILQSKVFGLMENMDKERKSLTIPLDSSCQEIFNENMDIFVTIHSQFNCMIL